MVEILTTYAEQQAEIAEGLPVFRGIKLLHIKEQLTLLLNLIGREGMFDTYTRYDISHIDEMLKILDWLIPENTKAVMTPADWLMTVLAIYFHDLGMLVTTHEYEARELSGFSEYCHKNLFSGDKGQDYQDQIQRLPTERADRLLYQEFVRDKHAERIRSWIIGRASDHLGITHHVMSEVDNLLKPLNPLFRRDLALICESHHLDDLNNLRKYKHSQPYGNSDPETVNIQYAAILLRTTDLLHITHDRTPSINFRTISPTDPVSQEEWGKQQAVRRVRPQVGKNREGNPDLNAPRDTIEVHAFFTEERGFFGLTEYLLYAQNQIRKSYEWAKSANQQGSMYIFPWREIDSSNIETQGFLQETFQFDLDQTKILELLTGHTLYNDTNIVLRELAQNAIDAVRLQYVNDINSDENPIKGTVNIYWDSNKRILSVEDNGTGMTQDTDFSNT